jgi:hypothetical protein
MFRIWGHLIVLQSALVILVASTPRAPVRACAKSLITALRHSVSSGTRTPRSYARHPFPELEQRTERDDASVMMI